MTFGREKRLILGWLALVAPIPLPFNEVLGWPELFLYGLALIYFLQRADRDPARWLPNWVLNILGFAYTPFLIVDLQMAFSQNRPFTALLHLIMFLVVVKLYSVRREKHKWSVMVAIFFLFIGSMATSSHVSIAIYLVAFMALALLALAALSYLHVLAAFGEGRARQDPAASRPASRPDSRPDSPVAAAQIAGSTSMSFRRPVFLGTLAVMAVAIPIFATMPRIREPFILGPGGAIGMGRTTGFSDSVDLSLTSAIRSSRAVAMRIQYSIPLARAAERRFKGATFDRYRNNKWYRLLRHSKVLTSRRDRSFQLTAGEEIGKAVTFLEPLNTVSLILPAEALSVKLEAVRMMGLDPGGAVLLPGLAPRQTLRYEVALAQEPQIVAMLDPDPESELSALDDGGVTPRMRQLAAELMGEGSDDERIDRLEQALYTGYSYTVDFVGRDGRNPLEDFLFVYKSGHCEYFASTMVLLLRSQGIPARFVTGFLGAEHNPLEDYYIVRQQNAHAWLEAYTPSRGWRIYDPTPPDGRPAMAEPGFLLLLSQMADFVTFRWDRYVLTYGAADQQSFFQKIRERIADLYGDLYGRLEDLVKGDSESETGGPAVADAGEAGADATGSPAFWRSRSWEAVLILVLFGMIAGWATWRSRRPLTGEDAYRRLRRSLRRSDFEIADNLGPLELERSVAGRLPGVAGALRQLIALYVRESFAERELDEDERLRLRPALRSVLEAVKAEARLRKREASGAVARSTAPASA